MIANARPYPPMLLRQPSVDAESLGLNRGCVGGGQTGRGCGHGFQLIVLSERRERKHEENKGTEDRAVNHGNPGAELMERETGFEPATSTLARSHSTS